MLHDKSLLFADATTTGATGTRVLGDVIDLTNTRDIGNGEQLFLNVTVATGITAASAGTYQLKLTSAANAALSSSPVDHFVTAAFVTGTTPIAAGTVLVNIALPAAAYGRYLGIQEVVATQSTTAGALDAFLSKDQASYTAYDGAR